MKNTNQFQRLDDKVSIRDQMIPMRDDVRLKTVIFTKDSKVMGTGREGTGSRSSEQNDRDAAGRESGLPVLLERSPYPNNKDQDFAEAEILASRGFTVVYQYCRGTGGSEGEWRPNEQERPDGIDTVNWLAAQPWCGSIGFFGGSYLALTGWAMMDHLPDKVKGMYLMVYGTDRYMSAWQDGSFRQDILTGWAMQNAGVPVHADYLESCRYRPQVRVDRDLWGVDLPWYRDLITHPQKDCDYWQTGFWKTLREMPSKVKIPIVIEEGWFDHHLGSTLAGYDSMPEDVKDRCLLRIGPWNHCRGWALDGENEEQAVQKSAVGAYEPYQDDHLDRISAFFTSLLLNGEEVPHGAELYLCGEQRWEHYDRLPETDKIRKLYLNMHHQCAEAQGVYQNAAAAELSEEIPESCDRISYDYDPENPVMTCGAESCLCTWDQVGSKKQPEPGYRQDVITFLSEPLSKPVSVMGEIRVRLFVTSSAPDTAFTARISEVKENGEAYNVRSGIVTLAWGQKAEEASAAKEGETAADVGGEVYQVEIKTWYVAWTFREGSRIRLDISSSDFPQYNIHSNYEGVWSEQSKAQIAHQTILMGKEYPSAILMPVAGNSEGKEPKANDSKSH